MVNTLTMYDEYVNSMCPTYHCKKCQVYLNQIHCIVKFDGLLIQYNENSLTKAQSNELYIYTVLIPCVPSRP